MTDFDQYQRLGEPTKREKVFAWSTAVGLQQVDGLTPSPYLIETAKQNIAGDISFDEVNQEESFDYRNLSREQAIEHLARFTADLWQIHVFGEGNTRTTAVFLIKYLRKLGFHQVDNDLFAQHSWFFRNALVRAIPSKTVNYIYSIKMIR